MDYKEIQGYYNNTIKNITGNKLYNGFVTLQQLISKSKNIDFSNRYETQYSTYQNMLKYSFEYKDDPEKENVYNRLIRSLLKLSDDAMADILYSNKMKKYYALKDKVSKYYMLDEGESTELIDTIAFEKEIDGILDETEGVKRENNNDIESNKTKIENLFNFLWLSDNYQNTQVELVTKIIRSEKLQWHDKSLIVTAVTLSLLRHFDESKFVILFNTTDEGEDQVWHRAFIGLVFALMYYDNRISYYPEILNRLKILQEKDSFNKNLEMFAIQYTWQKESEKIAKRIKEELMPDMMKMKSIIEEKLDLDNIVSSDDMQDKNPDWEDYFKDSPGIYKKFEEIQQLQTEGADIFMGAFSMLKQFPFFNIISNWFVPFYQEHSSVKEMSDEMKDIEGFESIIQGLSGTYFLCNSDKYSFCHNLKYVLKLQNPGMMDMFKQELDAMNEMADDNENMNINIRNKSIFTQYFQDLYRFYNLHPDKYEFENVFALKTDLHKSWFMKQIPDDTKIVHKLGEFYFNQDHYDRALEIFESLQEKETSTDLLEKIAYCYQKLGKLDEAISYYERALLIEKNKKWKTQQLAFCLRKKLDYESALIYYKQLEKEDPEDLIVQADIGHVYLCLEDYENALQYYFKVEYLAPENLKVRRPLAWCSFVIGKFDASKKYFERIMENDNNKNDLLNFGHVMWCMDNKEQAISCYKQAFNKSKEDNKWFERVLMGDSKYLIKHGIEMLDINLMIDYIKMDM